MSHFIGFQKCHNLKKSSFKNNRKNIYFFSSSLLVRGTSWRSNVFFTFDYTTKTLALREIFRKPFFANGGTRLFFVSRPCI